MSSTTQRTSLMTLLCSMIAIVVVLQIWLVSASVDALLGGDTGVLVPAALGSLALAAASGALLVQGLRYDRRRVPS